MHFRVKGTIFTTQIQKGNMSQAFVKESEEQWLHDVAPTINALTIYLTRENNGIRVYEKDIYTDSSTGKTVYNMSNGLSYSLDKDSKWFIIN